MSDSKVPLGYIYKITNKINGKTYVGARYLRLDKSWRSYLGGGRLIIEEVQKYGSEHFVKSFLEYAYSKETLYELELLQIKKEKLSGKGEYNLFVGRGAGGDTFFNLSNQELEDVKRKMSTGLKKSLDEGYFKIWNAGLTAQTDLRMKAKVEKAIALGTYKNLPRVTHTDETKKKMSEAAMGNKSSQINASLKQRAKIASTVSSRSLTKSGLSGVEKHDELLKIDIAELRKSMSREQLVDHLSVGSTYLTRFLRRHGFAEVKTSTDTICLICESRKESC